MVKSDCHSLKVGGKDKFMWIALPFFKEKKWFGY